MSEITHRFVQTNGIRMHIAEQGKGPTVLLLHGFPELWHMWKAQMAALADAGFHAVAPDLRGYGQTDGPAAPDTYTSLHQAGDIVGLIDALGEERVVVAGHDWGALVTWTTCLVRPDRVSAAIVLSIPYLPRGDMSLLASARAASGEGYYMNYFQTPGVAEAEFERDTRETFLKLVCGVPKSGVPRGSGLIVQPGQGMLDGLASPAALPPWFTEEELAYSASEFKRTGFTGGFNYYRMLDKSWELMAPWNRAKVMTPALFIYGDKDPVVSSPRMREQIASMHVDVPNLTKSVCLAGAGHWIQWERAQEVSAEMIAFLPSSTGWHSTY